MADTVEKIYCCDGNNNDALLGGILANQNKGVGGAEMAALMNNGNNWMNNPFVYLVWMMFANRMWGNDGNNLQSAEIQAQLNSLRTQMSDNQNANQILDAVKGVGCNIQTLAQNLNCDFNTLNSAICDVRGGVQALAGQVGFSAERVINAVNLGNAGLMSALQNCCCQTQQAILKMGYEQQLATCQQTGELRNGQRDLGTAITQGFSATAFQAQQDKCDIIRAGQDNTQRIIDTLNNHWKDELALKNQDLKFEISQLKQNQYLASIINGGCGCNNGNCFGQ